MSEADSSRFGLQVARGVLVGNEPENFIRKEIERLTADLVIFRCPAGEIFQVHDLIAHGYAAIHADTLVYYELDLTRHLSSSSIECDRPVRLAALSDLDEVAEIALAAFANYRSHYHANPLLPSEKITAGYAEWAASYVATDAPNKETWISMKDGRVSGFATCRSETVESNVEVVLNAILPQLQGQGIYSVLLAQIAQAYSRRGFSKLVISTQIWNYRVQRIWSKMGLNLASAYDTYHVNCRNDF